MRIITQSQFGGPEVLEVAKSDLPSPKGGEVLVRVRAIGLNPVESAARAGAFPLLGDPPFVLGWDISGVVEAVSPAINRFKVGDEVYGMPLFPRAANGYAEFVAAPSRQLARKPANIDHAHAAAVPLAALTAWQALVDNGRLAAGERVLVHGAGGGVGHFAVQIAKSFGATVVATASAAKADFVRSLGADEVIDYRATDFTEVTGDIDVVFDTVAGEVGHRSLPTLRAGGRYVTLLGHVDPVIQAAVAAAGLEFVGVSVEPDRAHLEQITALIEDGAVRPHLAEAVPFEEVARAHKLLDEGHLTGKLALVL